MNFFTQLDANPLGEYLRGITFPDSEGMGGTYGETKLCAGAKPLSAEQVQELLYPAIGLGDKAIELDDDDREYLEDVLKACTTAQFEHEGFTVQMVNWSDGDATLIFGIFDESGLLVHLENNDAKKNYRWNKHAPDPVRLALALNKCWTVFHPVQGPDVREQFVGVFTSKSKAEEAAGQRGYYIESSLNKAV